MPLSVTPPAQLARVQGTSETTRESILASGGHIAPPEACGDGLDVDLIVRDGSAGDNHWKTFASNRHDLLRASQAMQILDGLKTPAGGRLTLVLPPSRAVPRSRLEWALLPGSRQQVAH